MTSVFSAIYDLQYTFTPLRDLMSKRRKRSIFGDGGGEGKSAVECFVLHPIMEGSNGDKERLKGQVAEYFNFEYFNSANKKYEINIVTPIVLQQCWSLYCEHWTILPSPSCCSGSFRRPNGAWIPVSLVQLLAQFFILNCRHNFAGCLFSQIIKIKHRDFTPALNKLRHATAIILLKFARGLASKYL